MSDFDVCADRDCGGGCPFVLCIFWGSRLYLVTTHLVSPGQVALADNGFAGRMLSVSETGAFRWLPNARS